MKKSKANYVSEFLLSLFFPNRCCFCNELTEPTRYICDECDKALPYIQNDICFLCGAEKSKCKCRKSTGHYFEKICAPLYYEGSVKTCIHNFKFNDKKLNYKCLAELMRKCCEERYRDICFDYITYIPMRKRNLKKRGYNQSGLLAEFLSDSMNIPLADDMLIKLYNTKNQHDCGYFERTGNLFGVFDVNKKYNLENKNILLVDDIITTGSTLSECGKMLYLNGAQHVYCIAAALRCEEEGDE